MECTGLCELLSAGGMDAGLAMFLSLLVGVVLVASVPLIVVIFLIWVERKVAARIQDRLGPNRVGPFGLLQTFADMIKLLTKEDITPTNADRLVFNIAPILSVTAVLLVWAIVPFTPYHIGVDLEIGALYFVAVASFGTLAVMTAGWASNNKYALLGAFRVVAQLVSYEIPLALALLVPIMLAGTMSMQGIIHAQVGMWFFFMVPVAALLFMISSQAETGRGPFDLIEAESELVAGFNIEYSGMKFGMFFAAEFMHVFTNGVLVAVLFLGGWLGPGLMRQLWFIHTGTPPTMLPPGSTEAATGIWLLYFPLPEGNFIGWEYFGVYLPPVFLALIYLTLKTTIGYFIFILARNTFPRVRIDQLMGLNWKFFVPVSIINLLVVAFALQVIRSLGWLPLNESGQVDLTSASFLDTIPMTVVLLVTNIVLAAVIMTWLRSRSRRARLEDEAELEDLAVVGAAGD